MNQIELIRELPNWQWKLHSLNEILRTGKELVMKSDFVYRVGNVATVGFIYHSLTSPPWMWFALANNVTIADLIDFRRLAEKIPSGTLTSVDLEFALALRFAKLYGFKETEELQYYKGRTYRVMRKV